MLDLKDGNYQIPMHPDDREKTAFICPLGFFNLNRTPQELSGGGGQATFQRLMEHTVGDINLNEVLVYLNSSIVFRRTLEEHEATVLPHRISRKNFDVSGNPNQSLVVSWKNAHLH